MPTVFTLFFFMWSNSTLAIIGIGCGIITDHLARSGVIGVGASPMCGMPASSATLRHRSRPACSTSP